MNTAMNGRSEEVIKDDHKYIVSVIDLEKQQLYLISNDVFYR